MIEQVDIVPEQSTSYDYNGLDQKAITTLQAKASLIRTRGKRITQDIVDIGHALIEAKRLLPHGDYLTWAEQETGLSRQRAAECVNIAEFVDSGKCPNVDISILRLLSPKNTPVSAIEEVQARVQAGSPPTVAETKQMIQREAKRKEEVMEFLGWAEKRIAMTEEEREQEYLETRKEIEEEEQDFRNWWGYELVNPVPWTEKDKRGDSQPTDLECWYIFNTLDILISDCYADRFTDQRWAYVEEMRRRIDTLLSKRGVVESI